MRIAVGLTNPLARRRRIGLAELADEQWILSRNETLPGTPLAAALEGVGLPLPGRRVISGSLNLRLSLLETGRYVTLVPHSLLPFAGMSKRMKVLPIALPVWQTATMILTVRERVLGSAALRFLAVVRELAEPLAAPPDAQTRSRAEPRR